MGTIVVCCTKTCGCDFKMCDCWESWDMQNQECVEGKKNQMGNDIVTHGALTFCYLKG